MTLVFLSGALRALLLGAVSGRVVRIARVRNAHVEALVWRIVLVAGFALPALLYWRLAPSFTTSLRSARDRGRRRRGRIERERRPSIPAAARRVPRQLSTWAWRCCYSRGLIVGLAGMWRMSRAARPMTMPDDVRISERVRSPATFGAVILLPAEAHAWRADKLDAVLAHERAHVRSRDGFWSWLAQLHAAIFWFNPVGVVAAAPARDTGGDHQRRRGRSLRATIPWLTPPLLLDFARHPNSRSVAMSVAESNVPERIERLLARIPPAAALPRVARWVLSRCLIPVVVFAAADHARRDRQPTAGADAAVRARAAASPSRRP